MFRYASMNMTEHKCAQYAKVMKLAEVPYNRIWLSDAAQEKAREMVPNGAPILALCPTSGWSLKNWPLDSFVGLALRLPFQRVAILCAAHEREQVMPMFAALQDKKEVIDLSQTDPLEAAACLARCSVCVANDSGLMHISAAVGTPTVGIFGPTNEVIYAPHGAHTAIVRGASYSFPRSNRWKGLFRLLRALGYRPRTKNAPDPSRAMQAVSVDSVVDAAKKLMERQKDTASAASAALS